MVPALYPFVKSILNKKEKNFLSYFCLSSVYLPIIIIININYSLISVLSLSSALVSHLFGVFPTHGFSGDSVFPLTYNLAEVTLDNTDCRQQGELFCSPHSYPATAPTKQAGLMFC